MSPTNFQQNDATFRQRAAEWKRQCQEVRAEIDRLKAQSPVFPVEANH